MGKRLAVGLVAFVVAILVANVVDDSWVAVLPLLAAPVASGWHARSLGELLLLSLTAGAAYLLFLLINGQLLAGPDPVDGSFALVALYSLVIASLSLVVVSGGYVAKRAWQRAV